ncbi:Copper resistance protein B [Zhongshania aliphaticivorans]|uniref:Copper resistance protein B n=1 Tax=Zhongshania aliphaticivorans TaxID=1470434 RepID=A0A5S9NWV3_9GAMM|nr:copper resistance protein B [Zhongshania aliphaticivorans]CAA0088841.1 Copper resistance protein B [Zhongshania aliphaticivorans]CAA0095255.1 Copper resistance protein B [Zhongshania aliphaticivorans]
MKTKLTQYIGFIGLISASHTVFSHPDADPLVSLLTLDQLERQNEDENNSTNWKASAWVGKDLHKLWFKTEGELHRGNIENSEFQLTLSRAVSPFWDIHAGWRSDDKPTKNRHWFAVGLQGLAPYFFDTSLTFYIGKDGETAFRVDTEYDLLITQKLILSPSLELNLYGRNDSESRTGSGLSNLEAGLRLRYEIRREFAPYIGVNYDKKIGKTAEYRQNDGLKNEALSWVFGITCWY